MIPFSYNFVDRQTDVFQTDPFKSNVFHNINEEFNEFINSFAAKCEFTSG